VTLPITLSIVSHGHGALMHVMLDQLALEPQLRGVPVVLTLNLVDEPFDPDRWPSLQIAVIRNVRPKGFGANHNAAFARCRTPFVAVLNPDLRLTGAEPFGVLVARLEADTSLGLVAPQVLSPSGTVEDSVRNNLPPWSLVERHLFHRRDPAEPKRFRWIAGMCVVLSARAWRDIGGFDERYFLYCEDFDLCARLHLAGWSLDLEPASTVVHDARRDSHVSFRHLRWHLESLARVWTSAAFWRVTLGWKSSRGAAG